MTTVTSAAASSTAMARPIPREAPVTSATLRCRSESIAFASLPRDRGKSEIGQLTQKIESSCGLSSIGPRVYLGPKCFPLIRYADRVGASDERGRPREDCRASRRPPVLVGSQSPASQVLRNLPRRALGQARGASPARDSGAQGADSQEPPGSRLFTWRRHCHAGGQSPLSRRPHFPESTLDERTLGNLLRNS